MMKFNYAPLFTYGIKKKYNLKFPLKINTMILLQNTILDVYDLRECFIIRYAYACMRIQDASHSNIITTTFINLRKNRGEKNVEQKLVTF